jgi:hypothetical protein
VYSGRPTTTFVFEFNAEPVSGERGFSDKRAALFLPELF